MRSGRAVVGVSSDLISISPPESFTQSRQSSLSQIIQQTTQTSFSQPPSSASSFSQQPSQQQQLQQDSQQINPVQQQTHQLYDEANKPNESWPAEFRSLDVSVGNRFRYLEENYPHSNTCEKSKHLQLQEYNRQQQLRHLADDDNIEEQRQSNVARSHNKTVTGSRFLIRSRALFCKDDQVDVSKNFKKNKGMSSVNCCQCSGTTSERELGQDNMGLKEFQNEQEYYDYYYVHRSSEEDMDRRLTRRASDFEVRIYFLFYSFYF